MTAAPFDPLLSVFRNATDPDTVDDLPLSALVDRIRSSELAQATARIAGAFAAAGGGTAGKKATASAKRDLPAVTLAGVFDRRANAAWRAPSSLVQIDLDNLGADQLAEADATLAECPWVAVLWASPSGAGLKGAVRVPGLSRPDPGQYTTAWRAVTRWLASIGLVNDPAAKDCARLAFLAHDPEVWHNPTAEPFDLDRWAEPAPACTPCSRGTSTLTGDAVERRALAYVRAMPASIEGANGSAALTATTRTLRDGFDLTGPGLWRCLDAWNAERATPPWPRAELERVVASVESVPPHRGRGWLLHEPAGPQTATGERGTAWASERLLAERLAAGDLRRSLRYVPDGPAQGWRRWDGSSWAPSPDPVPVPLAASVHAEAAALIAAQQLDLKTARALESTASMRAILAQLQARDPMRFVTDQIDPPHLLATTLGILDLRAGILLPPDPDGPTFLHRAAVAYDPEAEHPLWSSVAAHVAAMPGGETVQRFLGAALIGLPPDRKLLVLTGEGGDGKGTLLRSCVAALGGFGAVLPAEGLSGEGRGAHGNEILSALATARLAYASEVPADLDWPLLKAVSGGDPRTTKRMHSRSFTVQTRAWLALATNTAPRVPDLAAADRCIIVRWTKPAEPDPDIVGIIATPGSERDAYLGACLRWLAEGAAAFLREGLGVPDFARPEVEPAGLSGWWWEEVESGAIVEGQGWTPILPFADRANRWHRDRGMDLPTTTALGTFLRSRLASRRMVKEGSKMTVYQASIVDRVGQG